MNDKFEALSQPVGYISSEGVQALNRGASAVIFPRCDFKESPTFSQEYVTALLAALEEKDQRIKELEGDVRFERLRLNEAEIAALIKRADSAEQREEHLKADTAVMGQRIANQAELAEQLGKSLDEANKTAQGWMERSETAEQQLSRTNSMLSESIAALKAAEQRLQQPIKLPDCDDYDATWQYQDACEEKLRGIGFKVEGE